MILLHFPDQGYVIQVQKSGGPELLGLVTPPSYRCLKPHVLCEVNGSYTLIWSDSSASTGSYATSVTVSMKISPTWCMAPVAILLLGARRRDGLAGSARLQKVRTE